MNDRKYTFTPEKYLEFLFHHKGNIDLYNDIKEYTNKIVDLDNYWSEEGNAKVILVTRMVVKNLDDFVFPVLQAILLFEDEPFKCIGWVKGILRELEPTYSEFIKSLILKGINDKQRFETKSNNLIFVEKEISEIDCFKLQNEPQLTCDMFEYFTGKNSYSNYQKIIESYAKVRGVLKTKEDEIEDFIKENKERILDKLQIKIQPVADSMPTKSKHFKKEKIPDTAFIQGVRTESFKTHVDVVKKQVEKCFEVTKNGEVRKYDPYKFLALILECHYQAADKTDSFNEKMICFINAESEIKRYIRKYGLSESDFFKIFEDLNDSKKRIEGYKQFGLYGNEPNSTQNEIKSDELKKVQKIDPLTKGDEILQIMDLYNIERDKRLKNLEHGQKFETGLIKEIEPFKSFFSTLRNHADFDWDWFVENLRRLRAWGVFDDVNSADDAIDGFRKLGVDVPKYVQNCYIEVETRTKYIDTLIDHKKYGWDEGEVIRYTTQLDQELATFSYDTESRDKYIKEQFDKVVKEAKLIEENVKNDYGYLIHGLYDGLKLTVSKEDLNQLFIHCEKQKSNISEFNTIFKILTQYFACHNKIQVLKDIISLSKTGKKTKTVTLKTFESYLASFDLDKIRPLINKYKNGAPEDLAILSFAFELQNIRPRKALYEAINRFFNTDYSRQTFDYHFKECTNARNSKNQTQIKAIKKEILAIDVKQ